MASPRRPNQQRRPHEHEERDREVEEDEAERAAGEVRRGDWRDHPQSEQDVLGPPDQRGAPGRDASAKAENAPEAGAPDAEAEGTTQTEPAAVDGKLTRLEVPELQARYLEVVGRPTGSTNKAYMIWKIREAQKGRIPLGPRKNAHREGVTFKVLPLRMESAVVDKLDEAWRSRGIKNRMEFFRGALGHYLKQLGAEDAAALFADATAA